MNFNHLFNRIYERKIPFVAVFFVVVLVTYAFLYLIDFYPEPIEEDAVNAKSTDVTETLDATNDENVEIADHATEVESDPEPVVSFAYPESIYIDKIDKEIRVLNPESNTLAALDEALLSGVVRHPDSANFSDDGNILILGHSSYLPNVLNKNFQAFNGVQHLTWGDKIRLRSTDTEYVYRVDKVYEAKAADIFVPNTPGEAKLTLATCNVLGAKEDRFIVEASLIGSYAL